MYECRYSYIGVLFLTLIICYFLTTSFGLSEFHSVECHRIAKYTAVVVAGMSLTDCLLVLYKFQFQRLRNHKEHTSVS